MVVVKRERRDDHGLRCASGSRSSEPKRHVDVVGGAWRRRAATSTTCSRRSTSSRAPSDGHTSVGRASISNTTTSTLDGVRPRRGQEAVDLADPSSSRAARRITRRSSASSDRSKELARHTGRGRARERSFAIAIRSSASRRRWSSRSASRGETARHDGGSFREAKKKRRDASSRSRNVLELVDLARARRPRRSTRTRGRRSASRRPRRSRRSSSRMFAARDLGSAACTGTLSARGGARAAHAFARADAACSNKMRDVVEGSAQLQIDRRGATVQAIARLPVPRPRRGVSRSRSKARSSSRRSPTSTPRATPPAR